MSAAMNTFLSTPAELVDLTLAAYEMGSLSTPDAMREWLYAQVKAGGGEGCDSEVTMIYAGLEDGRFAGYYDPERYTSRGAGEARADAPDTIWAPYTVSTVNSASDVQGPPGVTVSGSSTHIRTYHATRRAVRGAPERLTRWTTYDHRARPWYTEELSRTAGAGAAPAGWSSVYEFISDDCSQGSAGASLGITRTGALQLDTGGARLGVAAVDFRLQGISHLLNISLSGQDTWAYVVERDSANLVAISTGEQLVVDVGATVRRRAPAESSSNSIARSAVQLNRLGWGEASIMSSAPGADGQFEAVSKFFDFGGLDWLLVVGQDIHCAENEVWAFGTCARCQSGLVPSRNRVCSACNVTQQPDADQRSCGCPVGTYAHADAVDRGQVRCQMCSALRESVSTAAAPVTRSVAWDRPEVCPGGSPQMTAICPLAGLWVHLVGGQPASGVELHECPACTQSNCSAGLQAYERAWFAQPPTRIADFSFAAACKPNHRGFLCASCIEQHKKVLGDCIRCDQVSWWWVLTELVLACLAGVVLMKKTLEVKVPPQQAQQVFTRMDIDSGKKGHLNKRDVKTLLVRMGAPYQAEKSLWETLLAMRALEKHPGKTCVTLRTLPCCRPTCNGLRKTDEEQDQEMEQTWVSRHEFCEWSRHDQKNDRIGMVVFFAQTLDLIARTNPALRKALGFVPTLVSGFLNLNLPQSTSAAECNLPYSGILVRFTSIAVSPIVAFATLCLCIAFLARSGVALRWHHVERGMIQVFKFSFAPVTGTCVTIMFGCRTVVGESRWIEDMSVVCYEGAHFWLAGLSAVIFFIFAVVMPSWMVSRIYSFNLGHKRRVTSTAKDGWAARLCCCLTTVLHNSEEDTKLEDFDVIHSGVLSSKSAACPCLGSRRRRFELDSSGALRYYSDTPGPPEPRGVFDVRELALVSVIDTDTDSTMFSLKSDETNWVYQADTEEERNTWVEEISRARENHKGTAAKFPPPALVPVCWDELTKATKPERYWWFCFILQLKLLINVLYLLGQVEMIDWLTSLQIVLCGAVGFAHFMQAQAAQSDNRLEVTSYLGLVLVTIIVRAPRFVELESALNVEMHWSHVWAIGSILVSTFGFWSYSEYRAKWKSEVREKKVRRESTEKQSQDSRALAMAVPTFLLLSVEDQGFIKERLFVESWKEGDMIYSEGEAASAFFIVLDGHVELKSYSLPRSVQLGKGQMFCADALQEDAHQQTSATATALEELVCLRLVKTDFLRFWTDRADDAIERLLGIMDADRNNSISKDELYDFLWARADGYAMSKDETKKVFDYLMQSLDRDRDGQVTREELKLGMRRLPDLDSVLLKQQQGGRTMSTANPLVGAWSAPPVSERPSLRVRDRPASAQTARQPPPSVSSAFSIFDEFAKYDQDNSGALTKDECVDLISGLGLNVTRQYLEGVWSVYDTNGNGTLDAQEFSVFYTVLVKRSDASLEQQASNASQGNVGSARRSPLGMHGSAAAESSEMEPGYRDSQQDGYSGGADGGRSRASS
jgi:Ca2+-binding EF-hand superfamily protein